MKTQVKTHIAKSKQEFGAAAAVLGAKLIRNAIRKNGRANIIVATGASQFEMIDQLVKELRIDWTRVTAFHLDEYVGMPITHPASFRKYLWERFVSRLPLPLAAFHYINDGRLYGAGQAQNPSREGLPHRKRDAIAPIFNASVPQVGLVFSRRGICFPALIHAHNPT